MILLAYGVTVPVFQGRTVSEAGFIILGYKEVGQFLSTNLSMIVLKGAAAKQVQSARAHIGQGVSMARLMTQNGTELQKESTLQELVHPFAPQASFEMS